MTLLPVHAAALALLLSAAPAGAADFIRAAPDSPCLDKRVVARLDKIIAYRMKHVYRSDLTLVRVDDIEQQRFEPELGLEQPIERLYCRAQATISDGRRRTMWYLIEYGMGFASLGDNIEVCLSGFDRWRVYSGRCLVLNQN